MSRRLVLSDQERKKHFVEFVENLSRGVITNHRYGAKDALISGQMD